MKIIIYNGISMSFILFSKLQILNFIFYCLTDQGISSSAFNISSRQIIMISRELIALIEESPLTNFRSLMQIYELFLSRGHKILLSLWQLSKKLFLLAILHSWARDIVFVEMKTLSVKLIHTILLFKLSIF